MINSELANEVKKARQKFEEKTEWEEEEERKNCFTTSLLNLKLISNFKIGLKNTILNGDGLLVKDTHQAEKYSGSEVVSEITFKVRNQFKEGHGEAKGGRKLTYEESFSKHGSYKHILEIEPLDLGIEGMPPITRLHFTFADNANIPLPGDRELTKSELYKSKILTESAGKTFTMKIKRWEFAGKNDEILYFDGNQNYVFGSLNNPNSTNSPPNFPGKIVILVSLLLIFAIIAIVIIYRKRKTTTKK